MCIKGLFSGGKKMKEHILDEDVGGLIHIFWYVSFLVMVIPNFTQCTWPSNLRVAQHFCLGQCLFHVIEYKKNYKTFIIKDG